MILFARFLAFAGLTQDLHVAEVSQDPGPAPAHAPAESAEWLRKDLVRQGTGCLQSQHVQPLYSGLLKPTTQMLLVSCPESQVNK